MKREIVDCLLNGNPKGQKYHESVRMFCLNTRFLSPRCYEYLRTKFDDNLPHSSTIRKWFSVSNVTGEGGFNQSALETLKSLSEDLKKDKKSLLVSISFDEMSIRRHVQWQHAKKNTPDL